MTHAVIVLPQSILCSECGAPMLCGDYQHGVDHVLVKCTSFSCVQKGVPRKFMLTLTPVEDVEP